MVGAPAGGLGVLVKLVSGWLELRFIYGFVVMSASRILGIQVLPFLQRRPEYAPQGLGGCVVMQALPVTIVFSPASTVRSSRGMHRWPPVSLEVCAVGDPPATAAGLPHDAEGSIEEEGIVFTYNQTTTEQHVQPP